MKKSRFLFSIILGLLSITSYAQRGIDGPKTITAANTIVNEYTALSADALAGSTSISVAANTLNANNRFGAGNVLAQGDLVFIVQMQGASLNTGWNAWNGWISNYANAGLYEFAEVLSVSGSNTINLVCGLSHGYTATGKTQVVRVPRYTTLTVNVGAELTCDTWNGTIGGVLVVENIGALVNNGTINATGKGSRGGVFSATCGTIWGISDFASTNAAYGGQKGEGIAGFGSIDGQYCMACAANGGGGGNAHNAGGGGGSNVSSNFAYNGCGFPDTTTSTTYAQAWDLETAPPLGFIGSSFRKNASYGGGRGGYTFSSNDADALTVGPNNAAWSGDLRKNVGGFGGFPLNANQASLPRLFLGGGGGGGSQNDNYGGSGGNGGGIIYMMTYGAVSGTGTVTSNGAVGGTSTGTAPAASHAGIDGCGGGGGGGAIVLNATGTIVGNSAQANGGNGGDQIKTKGLLTTVNSEAEGPGGGGGGGYIALSAGSIIRTANGGNNGTSSSTSGPTDIGVSEFPPNGATKGGSGINNAAVTNFTISINNDTTCQGQAASLTAILSGSVPSGISYAWYNAQYGGTVLSTSLTLNIPNPTTTTTYYFRTCPGTYAVAATLTVFTFTPDAGPNVATCSGTPASLNASGGTIYSWTPATGLSSTTINNPFSTVGVTTLYTVTITNANGCTASDTVRVTVNTTGNATITPHPAMCINATPATLTAAQTGGVWSGAGITNPTGVFTPSAAGVGNIQIIYTITGACGDADTTHIQVNPLPTVNLGSDTTLCAGINLQLNAGNPGSTFSWTPGGSTGQTLTVNTTGTYIVQVTNAYSCVKRDTIQVSYQALANATITPHPAMCINATPTTLTAAQTGGIWSGVGITNPNTGVFTPSSVGNIQVIYTISGTCGDADTTHIQVNPLPTVNLGSDTTVCAGNSLMLNAGNPGSTYSWTPGSSTGQTLTVNTAGTYIVQVTNANSCVKRDTIQVTYQAYANATINPVNPMCSNNANITLTAAQTGGTWSGNGINNPSSGSFSPVIAGSGVWQIIYTIGGNCGNADTIPIKVLSTPNIGADTINPACPDKNNGKITLLISSGTLPFNYLWSTGDTTLAINNLVADTYTVTVTDSNNCVAIRSVTFEPILSDCSKPVIYVPNIFSPNGDGQNDVIYVHGVGIKTLSFLIYDRWGEKIFETSDQTIGWDGTYRGSYCPIEVYAYTLKATMSDGTEVKRKGNISLVR